MKKLNSYNMLQITSKCSSGTCTSPHMVIGLHEFMQYVYGYRTKI